MLRVQSLVLHEETRKRIAGNDDARCDVVAWQCGDALKNSAKHGTPTPKLAEPLLSYPSLSPALGPDAALTEARLQVPCANPVPIEVCEVWIASSFHDNHVLVNV